MFNSTELANFQSPVHLTLSVLLLLFVLYCARKPAHQVILGLTNTLYQLLRLSSHSLIKAQQQLNQRNREVVLHMAREQAERQLQREFFRINKVVERDLGGYPVLQRHIAEQIKSIEEDYEQSGEVPPPSPEWVTAVEAIAKLKITAKNNLSSNVLDEIHKTAVTQQQESVKEYRSSMKTRHTKLQQMLPYWRKLANTVDEVGRTICQLLNRSKDIDAKMEHYDNICKGTDTTVRTLNSSASSQFFISLFVVLIAAGGAAINFNLIALPMSEMVGAADRIGSFRVADVAAMVIILVELALGLYLMEALRITRLFPIIGSMDDKMRVRIIWITFTLLATLACVESALAFMRDQIAMDLHSLRSSLTAGLTSETVSATANQQTNLIPMIGQMILGFILPFALTFVAIPLESLVHSTRTVIGNSLATALKILAGLLRISANTCRELGKTCTHLYDALIFAPLKIEALLKYLLAQRSAQTNDSTEAGYSMADTIKIRY